MHILVIDDDKDIRDMLDMVLAAEGYEVATASDGVAGLDRLRVGARPSLILLDMMMPSTGRGRLFQGHAQQPEYGGHPRRHPHRAPLRSKKAVELGAAGCLVKPVELLDLLSAIHRAESDPNPRP